LRNKLLLETLWQTGCRLGEVIGGTWTKDGVVIGQYPGIRGKDYVICIHDLNGDKKLVVDTTNSFFCNEDSI